MDVRVRYGGSAGRDLRLTIADDLVVIRSRLAPTIGRAVRSRGVASALARTELVARFLDAGVEVRRTRVARGRRAERDRLRRELKQEKGIAFAGRVLCDPKAGKPVIYTENLFVKLRDDVPASRVRSFLKASGLELKRRSKVAKNAFFVGARDDIGLEVFRLARRLLKDPLVELCHPELVRPVSRKRAFPRQWHLKRIRIGNRVVNAHANVQAAWRYATGWGVTIAIIDDGIDVAHPEFSSEGKVVHPRDATRRKNVADPVFSDENHGTPCAGVACADGAFGASGVAPDACLMPIRLASGLGSQSEADAFVWAADHGADVISCSWGPEDGNWTDDTDPLHTTFSPLPDSTRLAIDYALRKGRGGLGSVVVWAAGNGGENVEFDGYASNPDVIAVAACNDRSKRSVYSDFGDAVFCAFPSDDFGPPAPRTKGIWTTDRPGLAGYNPFFGGGDAAGDYTEDFGGTSSACPGVAGVVALMLEANPDLDGERVRALLGESCRQIDRKNGVYRGGKSPYYGHGRVDAKRAVLLARDAD